MNVSRILLAVVASLMLTTGVSRATPETNWVGDTLNVQLQLPPPHVAFNGNFTAPTSDIDLTALPFTLSVLPTSVVLNVNGPFVGRIGTVIKVTDLTARRILDVEESDSSTFTLPTGALIFGSNFLQFNLRTLFLSASDVLTLDVSFRPPGSPVPSPGSLPILVSGLLTLAAARRGTKWKASH